ncbi:hypothetical protein F5Y19DRAFT_407806 [Xylariaceae sp. FL1651]|nr:hypothetical protein F5Y19DRAFT_407806 [Xylariaceae sp. FL1651]
MSSNEEAHPIQILAGSDAGRQRPRPPPNRRRDKPQLSCNLCRRRKLKCDRQHPCSTCKKRGLGPSCTYITGIGASTPATAVQDRLRHLEDLVVSYMHQSEGADLSALPQVSPDERDLDKSPAPSDFGSLKSSGTETKYQDQTHWNSILDAITELKEDFGESDDSNPSRGNAELTPPVLLDSPLLYGCRPASKEEILAAVPPKGLADCLVSECFEVLELSSCAIHKREFLKKYAEFWENPQSVPVMWLGLMFSILSISLNFRDLDAGPAQNSPQQDYESLGASYREKTVQCLILGQYTRCGPYVIETLLHYCAAEFMRRRDVNNEAWVLLSTTVHLAMRMGYHRDPDHFKSISPYDGELRRRLWAMLYHLDIAMSGQLGVPRLINDSFVDTAEPRNLLDDDFDPSSTELPPSRPESNPTPMVVVLSRIRIGRVYTAVTNVVTNTQPPTYAQILQVDRQIEEKFLKIPLYCRVQQTDSIMDAPQIILQRLFIQMNYHKAQIILHWRYMTLARNDDRYSYSSKTTVSAALKILELHHTMFQGLKTGGRLYSVRWRVTSVFNHDFLLAISILCFYLQQNGDKISAYELDKIKQAIRETKAMWYPEFFKSNEAKRAVAAIESVLPGILGSNPDESSNESPALTLPDGPERIASQNYQDTFAGAIPPFFDSIFEGAPMFPSNMNNAESFIDSVFAGFIDPWIQSPQFGPFL